MGLRVPAREDGTTIFSDVLLDLGRAYLPPTHEEYTKDAKPQLTIVQSLELILKDPVNEKVLAL